VQLVALHDRVAQPSRCSNRDKMLPHQPRLRSTGANPFDPDSSTRYHRQRQRRSQNLAATFPQ
jgi:hypothetical protein